MIPVEKVSVLPCFHRATIIPDYLDAMGHMNVRWYMSLYDEAGWKFFDHIGMTLEYFETEKKGGFALRQMLQYYAEVRLGETVAIHARVLGRSEKKIYFMLFMVNETQHVLASTFESLGTHADLELRRSAPFPPHIAANLDALIAEHSQLDWDAPVCGAINV
jgi:acyl-CoA thioester hydrolase